MKTFRVRRLAVIDLHGARGSTVRLWLVRAEFPAATILSVLLTAFFVARATVEAWIVEAVIIGIGANYQILTVWTFVLWDRERLAREYSVHDIALDGRYYSLAQLRLVVPFLFLILAMRPREREI